VRRLAGGAALFLLAAACAGSSSPEPTTVPAASAATSSPPIEAPILDEPLPDRDTAVESLCAGLLIAIGEDDDAAIHSLLRALSAAVRESDLGTEPRRLEAADALLNSVEGPIDEQALRLLAGIAIGGECEELAADFNVPFPDANDPEALAARLAFARDRWAAGGLGEGDYTIDLVVESSVWFDVQEETIGETECGLFGAWRVLVSGGEVVEAIDRFSGCRIDLGNEVLFGRIPTTIEAMFDFVEENLCCLQVLFDEQLGVPSSVGYDTADEFMFFGAQTVTAGHPMSPDEILATAAVQRQVWAEAGSADYTVTIRRSCFCPADITDPYTVTVRGGEVESTTRWDAEVELDEFLPLTVEDLFREVEESRFADSLTVAYHPDRGYPLRIEVDPVVNAVDEEHQTIVLDLVLE
jgi:hypothetical protein